MLSSSSACVAHSKENLARLSDYCDEFLVHGVDVEGMRVGILVRCLVGWLVSVYALVLLRAYVHIYIMRSFFLKSKNRWPPQPINNLHPTPTCYRRTWWCCWGRRAPSP